MGINQDTCQTYCLKRIVALGEFVPADTAAVCQDVVVPDNEFNVQDGSVSCRLCPGTAGFVTKLTVVLKKI